MEMNYDENGLQEIEHELHVEIIPGTEIMTDVGSHHFIKGGSHVLVPQPSSDPHDPLNWSPLWKTLCMIAASSVSFSQGLGPLALAPMFPDYIEAFDSNITDVVKFTGDAILVLGFSNFIWVPISTAYGRRITYIVSQVICLGSAIWRARATTYNSFLGACILNGIAAGPAETIQPAVIADMFFLHERGFWNTVYWVCYMGSLMVGPIISGSMSLHVGWRNFWWFYVALVAASLLMVIFMFPETKWHRLHPDEIDQNALRSNNGVTSSVNSKEGIETQKAEDATTMTDHPELDGGHHTSLGKGSPSKQQWKLYQPCPDPFRSLLQAFWTPWKLFVFPIVELSAFIVSWSCSVFLTSNLTQSQVFAAPPYNFSSQDIGFMNFATLIGAFIGLATAGPLSDWVSARATRKNGGVREPEMRLPAMIPYIAIMLLSNFVMAFGYQYDWPWEAIVIIGYGCAGIQVAALPAMATTYAVDSYKPVAGALMVAITVNKNLWGYGYSEFLTPWILKSHSYVYPIMTNMSLMCLWCLCAIPFYYFGKRLRRWSKDSSVHRL